MHELVGNMHMHTPYSDGEAYHAAIAEAAMGAGLDFVIVTDHNIWVDDIEGYYEREDGSLFLLMVGEEVHNVRREPQASHFLVYGAEREMFPHAANPQELIEETLAAGGHGFLAHPHEYDVPFFNEPNYGWHDWDIDGFTGLEIWNYMSSFKNRLAEAIMNLRWQNGLTARITAVRFAFNPEKYITTPEPQTLALWDELLSQGKRITAVGNSDAHATPMTLGPINRIVFPYEFLFRAVNTHVLTPNALSGNLNADKRMILNAIGVGNSWVGYDMPHSTKGFRFTGQGVTKGIMGDEIKLGAGATLQIKAPVRTQIRLLRNGTEVAQVANETNLTHIPIEPGAYRVECTIPYLGRERGWIYSNPIYLR